MYFNHILKICLQMRNVFVKFLECMYSMYFSTLTEIICNLYHPYPRSLNSFLSNVFQQQPERDVQSHFKFNTPLFCSLLSTWRSTLITDFRTSKCCNCVACKVCNLKAASSWLCYKVFKMFGKIHITYVLDVHFRNCCVFTRK